jgi:thiamine-phosphate pyrophosphorylase
MRLVMPRLYVILDAARMTHSSEATAGQLIEAGVRALQYRNKGAGAREMLREARVVAERARAGGAEFFVNDRPDIAVLAEAAGVHVGQQDLSVEQARAVVGQSRWVGVSTHNQEQFRAAMETTADYIAVGPVFATKSKQNPDPVVGTDFLRKMRPLTAKTIVAIGGITLERAGEVIAAGADSVAVISDILLAAEPARRAAEFLRILEAAKPAARD